MNPKSDPTVGSPEEAQELVGHFIVHCSLLDYRAGQLIARWFLSDDKLKYLSYVLHPMAFEEKKNVIVERLAEYHTRPHELRAVTEEAGLVMQRRRLVGRGLLSTVEGRFCIKSFSASRFLTMAGEDDIIMIDELPEWSARARLAGERLVELGACFI